MTDLFIVILLLGLVTFSLFRHRQLSRRRTLRVRQVRLLSASATRPDRKGVSCS